MARGRRKLAARGKPGAGGKSKDYDLASQQAIIKTAVVSGLRQLRPSVAAINAAAIGAELVVASANLRLAAALSSQADIINYAGGDYNASLLRENAKGEVVYATSIPAPLSEKTSDGFYDIDATLAKKEKAHADKAGKTKTAKTDAQLAEEARAEGARIGAAKKKKNDAEKEVDRISKLLIAVYAGGRFWNGVKTLEAGRKAAVVQYFTRDVAGQANVVAAITAAIDAVFKSFNDVQAFAQGLTMPQFASLIGYAANSNASRNEILKELYTQLLTVYGALPRGNRRRMAFAHVAYQAQRRLSTPMYVYGYSKNIAVLQERIQYYNAQTIEDDEGQLVNYVGAGRNQKHPSPLGTKKIKYTEKKKTANNTAEASNLILNATKRMFVAIREGVMEASTRSELLAVNQTPAVQRLKSGSQLAKLAAGVSSAAMQLSGATGSVTETDIANFVDYLFETLAFPANARAMEVDIEGRAPGDPIEYVSQTSMVETILYLQLVSADGYAETLSIIQDELLSSKDGRGVDVSYLLLVLALAPLM